MDLSAAARRWEMGMFRSGVDWRAISRRLGAGSVAVAAALLLANTQAAAAPFNPPKQYYLALGDSEAFGFQQAKFLGEVATNTYDPASFDTGYVDDFAAQVRQLDHLIHTVNYSCPGETSTSFITGGCSFHSNFPLHDDYPVSQSQLSVALDFLRAHPGKVSPITINLGANDIFALEQSCSGSTDANCVQDNLPAMAATLASNLDHILGALHDASPSSEIVVLNNADPYEYLLPPSRALFEVSNAAIAQAATNHRSPLVDLYSVALTIDPVTWCTYTAVCTPPLFDIHPTDLGYAVIARNLWDASGYGRLLN